MSILNAIHDNSKFITKIANDAWKCLLAGFCVDSTPYDPNEMLCLLFHLPQTRCFQHGLYCQGCFLSESSHYSVPPGKPPLSRGATSPFSRGESPEFWTRVGGRSPTGLATCLSPPSHCLCFTAQTISVDMRNTHLVLKCPEFSTWKKDSVELPVNASELDLGPSVNDPRGVYTCSKGNNQHTMKVHVRSAFTSRSASLWVLFPGCEHVVPFPGNTSLDPHQLCG